MASVRRLPSRFAGLSRRAGVAVIGALLLAMAASLWPALHAAPPAPAVSQKSAERDEDIALYEKIVARVRTGQSYYKAAAAEQRRNFYPLQPFVTMRLPTLAMVIAVLGHSLSLMLLLTLGLATLLAWRVALRGALPLKGQERAATTLLIPGMTLLANPHYLTLHELWAGILLALSIALHRPDRWGLSVLTAACALAVRELALPFVLLMAAFALIRRAWAELAGWGGLVVAMAVLMIAHRAAVLDVVRPGDLMSPPWTQFGGPSSALSFMYQTSGFRVLPPVLSYPIIVLCLFGWLSWRSQKGLFCFLLLCGYSLGFMLTGRANNFYWGLMVAPLLPVGLAILRLSLPDLMSAIRTPKLDLSDN